MFRRSGSVACFFVEGSMTDPQGDAFRAALAEHRFRTIENAASEETSVGWVTQADPTGGSFESEDLDADQATWLRVRIDKKSAPTKWLQIHRAAAERSAGRKLTAAERRDLKEDLLGKLLPRVLPSIQLVDALYYPDRKMILLFATSAALKEHFLSLFYKTFGVSLSTADPHRLALSMDLSKAEADQLADVRPVAWPHGRNGRDRVTDAATRELDVEQEVTT